jgi:hypothetical protein
VLTVAAIAEELHMSDNGRRLRIVQRASAIYDLIAIGPLALPGVAGAELAQLERAAMVCSLPGDLPHFAPTHLFFANVFGIFTVVWSVLRLARTEPVYGLCDSVLRYAFAATMLLYVFAHGVTYLLLAFAFLELIWGSLQAIAYARWRGKLVQATPVVDSLRARGQV